MFAPNAYLAWAGRYYGKVRFDLAVSGIAPASIADLGDPGPLDDFASFARLRAAVARYNDVPEAECIATLGTSQAIWLAYATLLSPGDDVLLESPSYEPLWRVAEGLGARVVRFERPSGQRFAIDPARVEAAMTPRTRLVVVTDLHNPGGVAAGDDVLREVERVVSRRGAHLFVDEVYAPFDALADASGVWGKSARKLGPNVLAAGSLTKCYGLGPHRVGWLLGPADVLERAQAAMIAACGHLPTAHAAWGALALGRVDVLAERTKARMRGRREVVDAWMRARPDLRWSMPDRGIFGFVEHTRAGDLTPTIEAGIAPHEVIVAAGAFFGVPHGFRLSWAQAGDDVPEALRRLERVLPPPA
jgi:hypothetical protein